MGTTTAEKLNKLTAELNATFLERSELTEALMLALLSANNLAVIGPPGTSKSAQTRALVGAITGCEYFEAALSKHRPAEAIFGPIDLKELRETGNYRLKRSGFITDAHVAFLDEGFKMSPVLGHDLLPTLNERVYHENDGTGRSTHKIPLSTTIIASNEFPTDENDDAAALYDRVLFRLIVDYLDSSDSFAALLKSEMASPETTVAWEELKDAIDNAVPAVELTNDVIEAMVGLRDGLRREGIEASDRRWRQSIPVLQASAYLNGRSSTNLGDLAVLRFILWDTPQQREKVERFVLSAANPFYEPVQRLQDMIDELRAGIDQRSSESGEAKAAYAQELFKKLRTARENLTTIDMSASEKGATIPKLDEVRKDIDSVARRGMLELLGADSDTVDQSIETLWNLKK